MSEPKPLRIYCEIERTSLINRRRRIEAKSGCCTGSGTSESAAKADLRAVVTHYLSHEPIFIEGRAGIFVLWPSPHEAGTWLFRYPSGSVTMFGAPTAAHARKAADDWVEDHNSQEVAAKWRPQEPA